MQLILDFFASEIDELDEKNVRITILGDKDALPAPPSATCCARPSAVRWKTRD